MCLLNRLDALLIMAFPWIVWISAELFSLGHSLGGATAVLTAAKDHRVKTLVLWSAVAHPHNDIVRIVGKNEYEKLPKGGTIDHHGYRLTSRFFESLSQHQPFEQLRKFSGDVLVVHGTADEAIPVDYAPLYQKLFWLRRARSMRP